MGKGYLSFKVSSLVCIREISVTFFTIFENLISILNQWCFVSKEGHISHCSCKFKNCGCEDDSAAIPAPTCDNKEVPKVSDSNFTISNIGTTYNYH